MIPLLLSASRRYRGRSFWGSPSVKSPSKATLRSHTEGPSPLDSSRCRAGSSLVPQSTRRLPSAPLLAIVAPHVPPAIALVIDRALAFHKAARWPNARAMQQALAQAELGDAPSPVAADYLSAEERTQVAPPPAMTLRGSGTQALAEPSEQPTKPLPAVPVASTVAGVAAHSGARRGSRELRLIGVGVGGLVLVVAGVIIAVVTSSKHPAPSVAETVSANASGPTTTAPPEPAKTPEPPVVAVDQLPTVAPATLPSRPIVVAPTAISTAPPPRAPTTTPQPASTRTPPPGPRSVATRAAATRQA
jgi:hypothetical protein